MLYILSCWFNPALTLLKPRFKPKIKHILKALNRNHRQKMDNKG